MSITSELTCLPGSYQTNRKKYLPVTSGRYSKYWNDQSNVGSVCYCSFLDVNTSALLLYLHIVLFLPDFTVENEQYTLYKEHLRDTEMDKN